MKQAVPPVPPKNSNTTVPANSNAANPTPFLGLKPKTTFFFF